MLIPYDGTVVDPFWVDLEGRARPFEPGFYRACCRASVVFQMGRWRAQWRDAQERNDFDALDRLDREYERIGI